MTTSLQALTIEQNMDETSSSSPSASQGTPIFFRLVEFSPDVPIRLDYHGKHGMDLGQVCLNFLDNTVINFMILLS